MAYSGSCLCENVKFSFEFDPMMQFQCHCTTCQKVFGTTLNALAMPEAELIHEGEMKSPSSSLRSPLHLSEASNPFRTPPSQLAAL